MPDDGSLLPWTEEQWAGVQRLVAESAARARVASSFLPLVGPLPGGQASVPALTMNRAAPPAGQGWYGTAGERLSVDDGETLKLTTIACEVFLTTQQADDPELASARQMLSRAAVMVGRLEDAIVFRGQPGADRRPTQDFTAGGEPVVLPDIYRVQGGDRYKGLRDASPHPDIPVGAGVDYGNNLVEAVVGAIDVLEESGQYGPFACALGHRLYEAAHRPSPGSLVLPSDRFVPFLGGGSLLRSSTLPADEGLLIALAGAPIDLVVATDVHAGYVQRTTEPRYVLRVSERVVLRLKQPDAVARLVTVPVPALAAEADPLGPPPDDDVAPPKTTPPKSTPPKSTPPKTTSPKTTPPKS